MMQNDKNGLWCISVPCGGLHHFLAVSADDVPTQKQPASVLLLPLSSGQDSQNVKFPTDYYELSEPNQCSTVK